MLSILCSVLLLGPILTPVVIWRLYVYFTSDIGADNPFPRSLAGSCLDDHPGVCNQPRLRIAARAAVSDVCTVLEEVVRQLVGKS